MSILLERTPDHIKVDALKDSLLRIEGVESIHDVHIWSVSSAQIAFSCHIKLGEQMPGEESKRILAEADQILVKEYGLNFENCIQIEFKSQTHQLRCEAAH